MAKSYKLFGGMFASFECSVFVELEKESWRARCRTHRYVTRIRAEYMRFRIKFRITKTPRVELERSDVSKC